MNEETAINIALKSPLFNDVLRTVIEQKINEVAELFLKQYEKSIEEMYKKRAAKTIEYVTFTGTEIAKRGVKSLGEEGYHFAFTITSAKNEENYIFYKFKIKETTDVEEPKKTIKVKKYVS